jgi:hypothetical protein
MLCWSLYVQGVEHENPWTRCHLIPCDSAFTDAFTALFTHLERRILLPSVQTYVYIPVRLQLFFSFLLSLVWLYFIHLHMKSLGVTVIPGDSQLSSFIYIELEHRNPSLLDLLIRAYLSSCTASLELRTLKYPQLMNTPPC